MNNFQLIDSLRTETKISKSEAAKIVDLFFNEMSEALKKGDRERNIYRKLYSEIKKWR